MPDIDDLVDQVIAAFNARRRTGWSTTAHPLTGDEQQLRQWHGLIEAKLKTFRHSTIDRASLIARSHRRFHGTEWALDFAAVADELQEMARDELQAYLVDNGMPPAAAHQVASSYSIGALLHPS